MATVSRVRNPGFEVREAWLCHTLTGWSRQLVWPLWASIFPSLKGGGVVNSNTHLRKTMWEFSGIADHTEPEANVRLTLQVSRSWAGLALDPPPKPRSSVCWRRESRAARVRTLESEYQFWVWTQSPTSIETLGKLPTSWVPGFLICEMDMFTVPTT